MNEPQSSDLHRTRQAAARQTAPHRGAVLSSAANRSAAAVQSAVCGFVMRCGAAQKMSLR